MIEKRKDPQPEPDPYWMSPAEIQELLNLLERELYESKEE